MEHAAGPLHQPPGLGLHGGGLGGPDLAAGRAAAPPALRGGVPAGRGRGGAEVRLILNIVCNITTHLQPGVLHGDAGRPGRGGHGRHQEGGAHGQVSPH